MSSELQKDLPDHDPWLQAFELREPPPRYPHKNIAFCSFDASVLDGLVPLDLPNCFSALSDDQLESILPGVARIILDGYGWIDWSLLYYESGVDDKSFLNFRKKLFKTLAKLVLNLYDVHDFQSRLDETNIIKSRRAFRDHLRKLYGEDFSKAMTDIAELKLDFSKFPFLREEDICYTLETYQMDCFKVSRRDRSPYAVAWPYGSSRDKRPCVVFDRHINLIREVLKEYIPLSESEKMDLLLEMDQEPLIFQTGSACYRKREIQPFGPLMRALSLEPWKDIQPVDLDVFNASKDSIFGRDTYFPCHIFRIIDVFVQKKASQVHMSKVYSTFPLQCGVWGSFSEEVHEVFRVANLNRRKLGKRFLSANLILTKISRTQLRHPLNTLLWSYEEIPKCESKEFIDKYVTHYICRWAEYVAKKSACDTTCLIKLEHIVLAIVFGEGLADWNPKQGLVDDATPKQQGLVDGFLKNCAACRASGSSPPKQSSPEKKKMKFSEDAIDSILFETDRRVYEDDNGECESWDHMEHLCRELAKYGHLPRKKVHERREKIDESNRSELAMAMRKFIIHRVSRRSSSVPGARMKHKNREMIL